MGYPSFGQLIPCETCCPIPTVESFFEPLWDITEHNRLAIAEGIEMAKDPKGWLVLNGDRGVGKTTIAKAILSAVKRREAEPFQSAALLDYWRSRIGEGDFAEVFMAHCQAAFFALDDLAAIRPVELDKKGDTSTTPWALERLTIFLDHRYARRLPTVITTDKDEVEMARIVGPRIADRVFDQGSGLCTVIPIGGKSYRTGRTW